MGSCNPSNVYISKGLLVVQLSRLIYKRAWAQQKLPPQKLKECESSKAKDYHFSFPRFICHGTPPTKGRNDLNNGRNLSPVSRASSMIQSRWPTMPSTLDFLVLDLAQSRSLASIQMRLNKKNSQQPWLLNRFFFGDYWLDTFPTMNLLLGSPIIWPAWHTGMETHGVSVAAMLLGTGHVDKRLQTLVTL